MKILHDVHLKDLIDAEQSPITVKATDDIETVARLLNGRHFLSAPVVGTDGTIETVVDVADIAAHVLKVSPSPSQEDADSKESLDRAARSIAFGSVADCVGTGGMAGLVTLHPNDPAAEAAAMFANGVHRVLVQASPSEPGVLVTQMDLARHLTQLLERGEAKEVGNATMGKLHLLQKTPATTVPASTTVYDAMKTMLDGALSAVAVVDANGDLFGNLSLCDLLFLVVERRPALFESVESYLMLRSPESTVPVRANEDDTVITVMRRMVNNHIHRLYFADADKTVHVVAFTDLFDVISTH